VENQNIKISFHSQLFLLSGVFNYWFKAKLLLFPRTEIEKHAGSAPLAYDSEGISDIIKEWDITIS